MSLLAVLLTALSAALALPRSSPTRVLSTRAGRPKTAALLRWPTVVPAALVAASMLVLFARGTLLALGLVSLGAAVGAGRLATSARARKDAERREEQVLEVCEVLVGELRAGQPPTTALGRCVEVWAEFEPVSTAARLGADVPAAFRRLGQSPGAGDLRDLAGAWQVSQGSGAGLAAALTQVAVSARESQSTRRLVASELASAQATARLVAALPLGALVMGSGIGGDPWQFLLATMPGLGCLASGLALAFAGLTWIDRIAERVRMT